LKKLALLTMSRSPQVEPDVQVFGGPIAPGSRRTPEAAQQPDWLLREYIDHLRATIRQRDAERAFLTTRIHALENRDTESTSRIRELETRCTERAGRIRELELTLTLHRGAFMQQAGGGVFPSLPALPPAPAPGLRPPIVKPEPRLPLPRPPRQQPLIMLSGGPGGQKLEKPSPSVELLKPEQVGMPGLELPPAAVFSHPSQLPPDLALPDENMLTPAVLEAEEGSSDIKPRREGLRPRSHNGTVLKRKAVKKKKKKRKRKAWRFAGRQPKPGYSGLNQKQQIIRALTEMPNYQGTARAIYEQIGYNEKDKESTLIRSRVRDLTERENCKQLQRHLGSLIGGVGSRRVFVYSLRPEAVATLTQK